MGLRRTSTSGLTAGIHKGRIAELGDHPESIKARPDCSLGQDLTLAVRDYYARRRPLVYLRLERYPTTESYSFATCLAAQSDTLLVLRPLERSVDRLHGMRIRALCCRWA